MLHRDPRAGGSRPLGGDGDEERIQGVARLAGARRVTGCNGEEVLHLGRVRGGEAVDPVGVRRVARLDADRVEDAKRRP